MDDGDDKFLRKGHPKDTAMEYARERSHEYVVLEHLLLALTNEKEIQSLIKDV